MDQRKGVPEYTDGVLSLFLGVQQTDTDFPEEKLVDQKMNIWYRELSVYDRLRFELNEGGKEVTMKIRIPRYDAIGSHHYCLIDGSYHHVYNATHVTSKEGFPETELTLIRPENNLEVAANA